MPVMESPCGRSAFGGRPLGRSEQNPEAPRRYALQANVRFITTGLTNKIGWRSGKKKAGRFIS